jgi:hypothetical protein
MEHVLASASTPSLKHAFTAPLAYHVSCPKCSVVSHHQTDPEITTEDAWITELKPTFSERAIRYAKPAPCGLGDMLMAKHLTEEKTTCKHCESKDAIAKKTWIGWSYAPAYITLAFDRAADSKQYKLTLPLEPDFNRYVRASGEKTKYRLVTVINKLKSGHYAAFAHAENGKWYRCINEVVKECKIEDWQGDERNGETVLAMYEQLE